MFVEPILKRVETAVQTTVNHASGSAIAAVPLLVAMGFSTAAANSWLREIYGERVAFLVLGAAYLLISLLALAIARIRENRSAKIAAEQLAQMPIVDPVTDAMERLNLPAFQETVAGFMGKNGEATAKVVAEKALANAHLIIGAGIGIMLASKLVDALNGKKNYG